MAASKVLILFLVLIQILSGSLKNSLIMLFHLRGPDILLRVSFTEETAEEFYRCLCTAMNVACKLTLKRQLAIITIKEKSTNDLANFNSAYFCKVLHTRSTDVNAVTCVRPREGEENKNGCDNGRTCQMYHVNFANLKACNFPCVNLQFHYTSRVLPLDKLDNLTSPEEGKCEPFTATAEPLTVQTQPLTTPESTTGETTKTVEITTSSPSSLTTSGENPQGKNDNHLTFITTGVAALAIIIAALGIAIFIWWKRKHRRSNASSMGNAKKEGKSCIRPFSENSGHRDMAYNVTEERNITDQYEEMPLRTDMRQDTSPFPDAEYLNPGEFREYEDISPRTDMREGTSRYLDTEYLNSGELCEYEDVSPRTDMRQDTSQYPYTECLNSTELRVYEDNLPRTDIRQDTSQYPDTAYLNSGEFREYEDILPRTDMRQDTSQYPDTAEYLNSGEFREHEDMSPRTDVRQDTSQYPDTAYLNSGEFREYEDISPRTDMRQDMGQCPQTEYLNLKTFRNYEETKCRMEIMKDTSQ
ncbi:hypothetical protein PoB_002618600 [Plakobranchus ocellatus]|uniref:Uncharacterized protein n=1 Tax=Plakobranchus ocellatus TaxID=259542 RepID=A0AAV3ZKM1_9GAST|nr:hypothetical protein PoB_002618600 [Plakobranchus ocellatus]